MAATATRARAAKATRLDELRAIPGPWGYRQIAYACGVALETAHKWGREGRQERDKVVAAKTGIPFVHVKDLHQRMDPRDWRLWLAEHGVTKADLAGVGVNQHMLPDASTRLGRSDGWEPEVIIGWAQQMTRMDDSGEAQELIPSGRRAGVEEKKPRPPRDPERAKLRDKVVAEYKRRAAKGESDWKIRESLAGKHDVDRKYISRLLVEARRMPDKYGEIPHGSPARKPESPRSIAAKTAPAKKTGRKAA